MLKRSILLVPGRGNGKSSLEKSIFITEDTSGLVRRVLVTEELMKSHYVASHYPSPSNFLLHNSDAGRPRTAE